MSNPAALRYPVARSRTVGFVTLLLAVSTQMVTLGWLIGAPVTLLRAAGVVGVGLAAALFAMWRWLKTPAGHLVFNGTAWVWEEPGHLGQTAPLYGGTVAVTLDLQDLMLLKLHLPTNASRFVWVERAVEPVRWHALRCALQRDPKRPSRKPAQAPTAVDGRTA